MLTTIDKLPETVVVKIKGDISAEENGRALVHHIADDKLFGSNLVVSYPGLEIVQQYGNISYIIYRSIMAVGHIDYIKKYGTFYTNNNQPSSLGGMPALYIRSARISLIESSQYPLISNNPSNEEKVRVLQHFFAKTKKTHLDRIIPALDYSNEITNVYDWRCFAERLKNLASNIVEFGHGKLTISECKTTLRRITCLDIRCQSWAGMVETIEDSLTSLPAPVRWQDIFNLDGLESSDIETILKYCQPGLSQGKIAFNCISKSEIKPLLSQEVAPNKFIFCEKGFVRKDQRKPISITDDSSLHEAAPGYLVLIGNNWYHINGSYRELSDSACNLNFKPIIPQLRNAYPTLPKRDSSEKAGIAVGHTPVKPDGVILVQYPHNLMNSYLSTGSFSGHGGSLSKRTLLELCTIVKAMCKNITDDCDDHIEVKKAMKVGILEDTLCTGINTLAKHLYPKTYAYMKQEIDAPVNIISQRHDYEGLKGKIIDCSEIFAPIINTRIEDSYFKDLICSLVFDTIINQAKIAQIMNFRCDNSLLSFSVGDVPASGGYKTGSNGELIPQTTTGNLHFVTNAIKTLGDTAFNPKESPGGTVISMASFVEIL